MTSPKAWTAGGASTGVERWQALDLVRVVAVILMVQGHTFTALLDPSLRNEPWHIHHAFVHGLTAPLFFFASGLAFGVATFKHWSSHTSWGNPVRRRLGRYAWLLFIGYMLNVPHSSFSYLLNGPSPQTAEAFFKVDALQQIAVALILAEGLVLLVKKPRPFIAALCLLAALFVFGAPAAWKLSATLPLPVGVLAYLNGSRGSIFPIFPWTGFLCAGVVTAYFSIDATRGASKPLLAGRLATMGALLWSGAFAVERLGRGVVDDNWETRPTFFFTRIGLVFVGFSVFCLAETLWTRCRKRRSGRSVWNRWSFLEVVGQETLVIYVFHLLLIYGLPFVGGLADRYEATLSIGAAAWASAVLLAASVIFAMLWRHARQRWPRGFPRFRYALAVCALLVGASLPPPEQVRPHRSGKGDAGAELES